MEESSSLASRTDGEALKELKGPGTEIEVETSPGQLVPCTEASGGEVQEENMLRRFEALSNMFKSEVEVLFGREKDNEDLTQKLRERVKLLEQELEVERAEAAGAALAIRNFVAEHQASEMPRIFEEDLLNMETGESLQSLSSQRLCSVVHGFIEVNGAQVRPELEQAQKKILELQELLEAGRSESSRLQMELSEARKLKSQEERDLVEFKSVREKASEVQDAKMEADQLRADVEELRAHTRQLESRSEQQKAVIKEKSDKIIDLVRQLEHQGDQVRLLSDENNTLRLELGRDAEYLKVVSAHSDPLSYRCAAGALSEELANQEKRMREDLRSLAAKFPGLPGQGDNCSGWCELQISRVSDIHTSFLHRLQDYRKEFPDGVKVEFVTPTEEIQSDWTQHEAQIREAGAEFQEAEKVHTKRWEEHRLQLTSERDAKVKQLLDQAERSTSKAEKQLLLHQAKLFGQRIDAQLERAWEEQRKERDLRWTEHQQKKQEVRQKIKDESISMVQRAEDKASTSSRFIDAATSKLASVEDAWLRNAEKAASINASSLKGGDLESCLRNLKSTMASAAVAVTGTSSREDTRIKLPVKGSQHTGLNTVLDQVEELLKSRTELRKSLRADLEEQSRQQLRSCVEKFLQRETTHSKTGEEEAVPEYSQAASIIGLLRMRQHRHLSDVMRRQFQDYLLVLRVSSVAASWLLPSGASAADLPPLPPELNPNAAKGAGTTPAGQAQNEEEMTDDAISDGFLYNSLCQRILDKALKVLQELQREELLSLKRAYTAEQRLALQHLCQLEGEMVTQAVQQDLKEFECQMATRLLSDSELSLNEQRKQIVSQVDEDVSHHVAQYRRQLKEEEQAVVKERRKFIMNRIVILQANGTVNPSERAFLQRLRAELRACEAKIELHDNEFASEMPAQSNVILARPPSGRSSRPSSASRRRPESPLIVKPPERHSQAATSPRQRQYASQPAATGQVLPWDTSRPESPACKGSWSPASSPRQLPQFGSNSDTNDSLRSSPEFGMRPSPQPIYDWPFDSSLPQAPATPPPFSARSLSSPVPPGARLKPLDCFAPRSQEQSSPRQPQAGASQPCAGACLQENRNLKLSARNRSSPPLLPQIPLTPR